MYTREILIEFAVLHLVRPFRNRVRVHHSSPTMGCNVQRHSWFRVPTTLRRCVAVFKNREILGAPNALWISLYLGKAGYAMRSPLSTRVCNANNLITSFFMQWEWIFVLVSFECVFAFFDSCRWWNITNERHLNDLPNDCSKLAERLCRLLIHQFLPFECWNLMICTWGRKIVLFFASSLLSGSNKFQPKWYKKWKPRSPPLPSFPSFPCLPFPSFPVSKKSTHVIVIVRRVWQMVGERASPTNKSGRLAFGSQVNWS